MTMTKNLLSQLPRRRFLQTAAGAAAFGLGSCALNRGLKTSYSGAELKQPPVEKSVNGFLDTTVNAQMGAYKLGPQDVNLRSYNGRPVGNTIDIHAGDTLKLKLNNLLPFEAYGEICKADPASLDNTPRGFNTTNMHVHGLHVSPKQPSDDILLAVKTGESYHYQYEIPAYHPPGTYFYHAHVHGSTAIQVSSGMSGALIIRGDVDEIPAIKAAEEKVLMIQTQRFDESGQCESFGILNKGDQTYVNGQLNPVIRLRKGEVQRWRIVNASHMVPFDLKMQLYSFTTTMPFTVLCLDGNPLVETKETNSLRMVPGNRADVLVKGFNPGTYYLTGGEAEGTIATIIVEDVESDDMVLYAGELPQSPLLKHIEASEVTYGRRLDFDFVYGEMPKFTVNNKPFSCEDPWEIPLNSVEEWEVYNHTAYPHPFHIHVNPFQVISGGGVEPGTWLDTLEFPAFERIKFRTRFETFTGTFVFHCHNLMHEDTGMMQAITVVDT